jgi:RNA polymerase-binding transcription factor DksA
MVKQSTSVSTTSPPDATPAPESSAKPSPPARRSPSKSAFDRRTLGTIKGQLAAQRDQLLEQLKEIEDVAFNSSQSDMSGEVSFDEDSADAGSFTFEREKDLSIAHNVRDLLGKMAKALDKIEAGTYGVCESCGRPIEPARVKALPHVLLCLSCKKAEERR